MSEKRVVEKLLISLMEKYDCIVGIIEETKEVSTLSVHELVGSLEHIKKDWIGMVKNLLEVHFNPKWMLEGIHQEVEEMEEEEEEIFLKEN